MGAIILALTSYEHEYVVDHRVANDKGVRESVSTHFNLNQ